MQINSTTAAAVMACASIVTWIGREADKLINEAPASWMRVAARMAAESPRAASLFQTAKEDGIVTMSEVLAIEAATKTESQSQPRSKTARPKLGGDTSRARAPAVEHPGISVMF